MGSITKANTSQKGQNLPNFTEDEARAYFEAQRWPDGKPVCPHCAGTNCTRMDGAKHRAGAIQCNECRRQFTVTVGSVMEDTHLSLSTWVKAFHYMCSAKKGMSALQLQRNLGLGSYRTAWHLAHRIRLAMKCQPIAGMLAGEVQVDETYVGGKPRKRTGKPRVYGRGTKKQAVMVLVETNGNAVSHPIERLRSADLKDAMRAVIDPEATIVTDDLAAYPQAAAGFAGGHYRVTHSQGQYVRTDGRHTNTAESFFALLKRGHYGVFHHLSKKHLHRYCDEFTFRWNGRTISDSERRDEAVKGAEGKRLMYKSPKAGLLS
jgi:transposase-like protein